ncbi:aminodeoxychorismate/anthranilate synthase component II [Apilactobacillus nanyangensis]|uniref:Aminodeoxychorismate/anthranilate synthase component II n=1 Tax=Apilactobacillus nanyangensis TaxID=2799579 RepID=A0ABT0HYJ1_9LACO|nr:aminodeoxychorismate/anthranilate synthase component II [Apilactobacillus nanyangensis]MCK8611976.1 aminodeoxychorismate/anthranilate synthase component II [Apilactobacillus nanyangensis]
MILLIDNYDSFTFNLVQEIGKLVDQEIVVLKNDEVTVADLDRPDLTALILSPGPGRPEDAGNMNEVLKAAVGKAPVLGVCLGHQAIGEVYGAQVTNAPEIMHGKTDMMEQISDNDIFANCPSHFTIGRYHSLVIDEESIPNNLNVIGRGSDGTVQAVADEQNHVYGVEFHPESIMTDQSAAQQIFSNFFKLAK